MTCANGSQVAREEDNRWIACEMEAGVAAIGDGGVDCVQRRADHDQRAGIERLAVAESEIIAHGILRASSGSPARHPGPPPPRLHSAGVSLTMSAAHCQTDERRVGAAGGRARCSRWWPCIQKKSKKHT